ncbi:hypothetical protein ACH42_14510 [Endozoicomonas sp. (ex Bugula neritina AB1)]|nr:hypothetical protein ACH42_14510 [Endozoicomonas sp. (ex Bugula neritina AB1)]
MERVVSEDGSTIAYQVSGKPSGSQAPALLLVHGTGGSYARWEPVLPMLESCFQVYSMDRRGRNTYTEHQPYSIGAEYQDVVALVNHIHKTNAAGIYLLGHSFGGLCTLEATLLTSLIDKLVLYEPPVCGLGVQVFPDDFMAKIDQLLQCDDREGVITAFLRDVVTLSSEEMELFRSSKKWGEEIAAAHTLPRELKEAVRYQFDERRFQSMRVPTLLLCGSHSPPFFKVATDMIEEGLPVCRQQLLPGQQHVAMDTAPELFARVVIDFLCQAEDH